MDVQSNFRLGTTTSMRPARELDLEAELRTALASRYAIEREIGRGGMARVYLARDEKHDRPVAIKALHPAIGSALSIPRFEREIKLVSRLQHPHIVPLYDSGEAAGTMYYVMPYMPGESLRRRMETGPALAIDEAVKITRQIADALEHAHEQNILHRDITPGNILLSGGHATLADFGIARAITASADERLTATGFAVGTAVYMSPEQSLALPDLDARSDIYSLGCVLFEMLVGMPPFVGVTGRMMMARRFTEPAPDARSMRPGVPEHIAGAARKALARVPHERYATAADFARALAGG